MKKIIGLNALILSIIVVVGVVLMLSARTPKVVGSVVTVATSTPTTTPIPTYTLIPLPTTAPTKMPIALPTRALAIEPTATSEPTVAPRPGDGQIAAQQGCIQQFAFVADTSISDDSPMQPGQQFDKAWRLTNNGTCDWTATYSIAYVDGAPLGGSSSVFLGGSVLVGQTADLHVPMTAPMNPGTYTSYWELRDESATRVGSRLYVRIVVPESKARTRMPVKATATPPSTTSALNETEPSPAHLGASFVPNVR
jgi:hypothetical protein